MGDYKTTNTTDIFGAVLGVCNAKVEDRDGNIGRGAGFTQEEADRDAFSHLKNADPSDSYYEGKSKPSSDESSSDWFSFGGDNDNSKPSSESNTDGDDENYESSEPESSPSYHESSYGDDNWTSGGTSNEISDAGVLSIVLGALIIFGLICFSGWSVLNKSLKSLHSWEETKAIRQSSITLEESAKNLSLYVRQNNLLEGNFSDYRLIMPPASIWTDSKCEILWNRSAFVGPKLLYIFRTSDGGTTWRLESKENYKNNSATDAKSTTPTAQPKSREAMMFVWRAETACQERNFDKTIADCSKALELDPTLAEAYNYRGRAFYEKGYYEQAIADCSKAIELDPKDYDAYHNRAFTYYKISAYDRAIADWSKVIELEPIFSVPYIYRGRCFELKGDLDQAITDYTKAIALEPGFSEAYRDRGFPYYAKGDYDRAIADWSKTVQLWGDASSFLHRGFAYQAKGENDKAWADFKKCQALGGTVPIAALDKLKNLSRQ
ncbi:MAG: tetratricopeptide repeat protein [Candidatus Buchananbacteria bacterium]